MRFLPWVLAAATIASASGCRHGPRKTSYRLWGKQVAELAANQGRVEDVSLLLGAPPVRCDPVPDPGPTTGLLFDQDRPVIRSVLANGPADVAGIRPGDEVVRIAGREVASGKQAHAVLRAVAREGQRIEIVLIREIVVVSPRVAKMEQCYWDSHAGGVSVSSGGAYAGAYGGGSHSSGAAYERFFRTSCRVIEGMLWECSSNWQD